VIYAFDVKIVTRARREVRRVFTQSSAGALDSALAELGDLPAYVSVLRVPDPFGFGAAERFDHMMRGAQ